MIIPIKYKIIVTQMLFIFYLYNLIEYNSNTYIDVYMLCILPNMMLQ